MERQAARARLGRTESEQAAVDEERYQVARQTVVGNVRASAIKRKKRGQWV